MGIRIKDIALKSGVSVGTVDRIIHQRGKVSQKAKEKVDKAIKELGYAPDLMARNLALKKVLRIVCLLPNPSATQYWERPIAGVKKATHELSSFKIQVETVLFHPRKEDFKVSYEKVLELNPDGVVYVPMFSEESMSFANQLRDCNIPFIHINIFHAETEPLSYVGQDPIAAGKVAANLCKLALKEGNKILIAYISKKEQEYAHLQDRIEGFTQFFEEQENTPSPIRHLDIKVNDNEDEYNEVLMQHLKEHNDTQIIYVPNSRAYKIASIIKKHDLKNIMVIGFDTLKENIDFLKEGFIDFLIGQQSKSQGYNAVKVLFNALFRKEEIHPKLLLPIDILNKENIDYYEGLM